MTTARLVARRDVLKAGVAAGGAVVGATALPPSIQRALAVAPAGSSLHDIEHVVILMQENRSFDHYFGTLSGVRGFGDPGALVQPGGSSVFRQVDPDVAANPSGYVLPFRLNDATSSGQCVHDLSHAWSAQHFCWNQGQMDGWVTTHRTSDDNFNGATGTSNYGPLTMSYYARADIPYHYALADAFTICDAYHCSVFGPTNPNRLMSMSAWIDPDAVQGGPCVDNSQNVGQLSWTTYPERLQAAGVSWFIYSESNNDTNNVLPLFAQFQDPSTDIYRRANTVIPTPAGQRFGPALLAKLKQDVLAGKLPQVSWILASDDDCEHPAATPNFGARFVAGILDALTADPAVWAKTALFYCFDENDGFCDHVVPPTAPAGTPGEYINPAWAAQNPGASFGITGPIGLGFRVPMLVVSPFSRGGLCATETFDHTSILRFLETRFGVEVPNLNAWRRSVCGDLTSAFNFAAAADVSMPVLPDAAALAGAASLQCSTLPAPTVPAQQSMPMQEAGPARAKPSGVVPVANVADAPWVPALAVAGGAAALAARWMARRRDGAVAGQPETKDS